MRMQVRAFFYIILCIYLLNNVYSLDVGENSDEMEIFKHLFGKLNKIIDGNDALQKNFSEITARIQQLDERINKMAFTTSKTSDLKNEKPLTCSSLTSPSSAEPSDNYCFGSNWIVIQRRTDGSQNFFRGWNDYKYGFGNVVDEFFLGLEKIHQITRKNPHELLIIMEDYDNSKRYAKYDQFEIGGEEQQYVLKTLGNYSGNAGDSLTYHIGSKFSTKDRDNDEHSDLNCAGKFQSSWWFKACFESNLNGCYSDENLRNPNTAVACGIHWKTFRGLWYSLKFVEIMVRPKVQLSNLNIDQ